MPRIEPLQPRDYPPDMRAALAALRPAKPRHEPPMAKDRPKALNVLGTMAHHPALAQAFFTFNGHILMGTTLSERQRELIVMRVAALRRCGYEWAQHLFMARDVGLSDEEIGRIAYGPDAPFWGALDAAMLRADQHAHLGSSRRRTRRQTGARPHLHRGCLRHPGAHVRVARARDGRRDR